MSTCDWVWLNGDFVPASEARVSLFDHGFLYGAGLFETLRCHAGKPLLWQAHMERLATSWQDLELPGAPAPDELRTVLEALLERNGHARDPARARLQATFGVGRGLASLDLCQAPTVAMTTALLPHDFDEGTARGVRAVPVRHPVTSQGLPWGRYKLSAYFDKLLLRRLASRQFADEAILVNAEGLILEGTTTNVFIVCGDLLRTPPVELGLLPGIARQRVLELAPALELRPQEAPFSVEELLAADGAFLTNAVLGVAPLVEFDGVSLARCAVVEPLRERLWEDA